MMTNLTDNPIGLIAGKGDLPLLLIKACLEVHRPICVLWLDQGEPVPALLEQVPHEIINIAAVGKAIKFLKHHEATQIVFAGSITRPSWSTLRPDLMGVKLLASLRGSNQQGDNSLLSMIIRFFEEQQFHIIGVEEVAPELLAGEGVLTKCTPDETALADIQYGKEVLHALGHLDVGQSIVVQQGVVLGIEAIEGTDRLIERCGLLAQQGPAGILVKCKKQRQDRRIDLPTIGINTIEKAHQAKLRGIAVQANQTLIIDKPAVLQALHQYQMFLLGIV